MVRAVGGEVEAEVVAVGVTMVGVEVVLHLVPVSIVARQATLHASVRRREAVGVEDMEVEVVEEGEAEEEGEVEEGEVEVATLLRIPLVSSVAR